MDNGIDLELDLETLFSEPPSRVSDVPEVREVEVVRDAKDPKKGFVVVRVQGLSNGDRLALGRQYDQALRVFQGVQEARANRAAQLNPDGPVDPVGVAYAMQKSSVEAEQWSVKAVQALLKACVDICALGVVGWEAGQLRYKGANVDPAQESRLILGRPRQGLCTKALQWLEAGGFSFRLAAAVFAVSDARPVLTKEQQWGKEETPRKADPLDAAGLVESPQTSA